MHLLRSLRVSAGLVIIFGFGHNVIENRFSKSYSSIFQPRYSKPQFGILFSTSLKNEYSALLSQRTRELSSLCTRRPFSHMTKSCLAQRWQKIKTSGPKITLLGCVAQWPLRHLIMMCEQLKLPG